MLHNSLVSPFLSYLLILSVFYDIYQTSEATWKIEMKILALVIVL